MASLADTRSHRSTLAMLYAQNSLPFMTRVAIELAWVSLQWSRRSRTRKQLRHLSDAQLYDIGVSRDQADAEATKTFWRP